MADISSFGKGSIACNDDGQCKKGKCNGDACDMGDKPQSKKRADGSQAPIVEDTTPCITAVPAVMYNCNYFPDRTVPRNDGTSKLFKGICTNIMNHFKDEGLGAGPIDLTYAQKNGKTGNRGKMCGAVVTTKRKLLANGEPGVSETWSTRCQREGHELADEKGLRRVKDEGNMNWSSCDEFPFNR